MTKAELCSEISKRTDCTIAESKEIMNALMEIVKETVSNGEPVFINGFLSFKLKDVPERRGISYLGGETKEWVSPARTEISVKLSKSFKTLE